MKVFTGTNFEGHYPVGVAAVVVATDANAAQDALLAELRRRSLLQSEPLEMRQLSRAVASVNILCDGDY